MLCLYVAITSTGTSHTKFCFVSEYSLPTLDQDTTLSPGVSEMIWTTTGARYVARVTTIFGRESRNVYGSSVLNLYCIIMLLYLV